MERNADPTHPRSNATTYAFENKAKSSTKRLDFLHKGEDLPCSSQRTFEHFPLPPSEQLPAFTLDAARTSTAAARTTAFIVS